MSTVAVLGAGAGGAAAAVQLLQSGHTISLWSRTDATITPFRREGISFDGALGRGRVSPSRATTDLASVLEDADVVVVCLPAIAHEQAALALAELGCDVPIVLDPGGTGGALLFRKVFTDAGSDVPAIAELSTLTYIARMTRPASVSIFTVARLVHAACLPGGESALDAAEQLFGGVRREPHVLSTSLRNINLVLHPPVALLSVAWVEATHGDFFVYSEAMTPGVYRLVESFDGERRAVGAMLGIDLPHLVEEMMEVGSVDQDAFRRDLYRDAISRGAANRSIKAPESLDHRYYREDLAYAVVPFAELARICGVATPIADAMVTVGSAVLGADIRDSGLSATRLGIDRLDASGLLALVTTGMVP